VIAVAHAGVIAAAGASGPPGPSLPIDWSTDLLFARASAATYWDGTTLTRYASGAPRILGDGSLYVEGSRTNKVHDSSTYSSLVNATAIDDSGVNPAGDAGTADQITVTSASGRANVDSGTNLTAGAISASVFVRWLSGADGMSLNLALAAGIGSTNTPFLPTGAWGRFVNSFAGSAGGALQMRPLELDSGNDNVYLQWGGQAEEGSFPSQLIETSGSAGTRLADDAYIESANVPTDMRTGVWRVVIRPRRASTEASDTSTETLFSFGSGTDNRVYIDSSNQIVVRCGGVNVVTTAALTWAADEYIGLVFDSAAGRVTSPAGNEIGTPWAMPAGDVQVGNDDALTTAFFGALTPPAPRLDYDDVGAQLIRINSLEGSLAFSGGTLTGVTDMSPAGETITVEGAPDYTAVDVGLNGAPSFSWAAASSVVAPNVDRASIRFVATVFYRVTTGSTAVCDGTVAGGRYFTFFNPDGNIQSSYGSYLAAATLEPTVGRKRCLFPNDNATVGKLNDITLSALPVGSASGNGLTLASNYIASAGGARMAFYMACSAVPSAPILRCAFEIQLIADFG
jgi:hypothetical protein